jgi:hypothetical protein
LAMGFTDSSFGEAVDWLESHIQSYRSTAP